MAPRRCNAAAALRLAALVALAAVCRAQADVLRINGAATSPMDAIAIEQAQKELFAVASFMKFGQLGYAPEWTTLDKNTGASPQAKPNFAQKHPHLVLAMQLGLAVKAIEKLSESGMLDKHDGKLEGLADGMEPFLPPRLEYFVDVVGGDFVVGGEGKLGAGVCRKLYPAGTNKYELVEAGAGAPVLFDGKMEEPGLVGPEVVRRVMEDARHQGLDFIRFNAFAADADYSVLSPGGATPDVSYNEAILRGLDYVVDQARMHGLRVLMVFTDYFRDGAGGPLQYMTLGGADLTGLTNQQIKAYFYTDPNAQTIFRNYVQTILDRVNSINGRVYRADPTVFGWDIMNEPRCEDGEICNSNTIPNFVASTYALIKGASAKQPVTVGTDGFYDFGPQSGTYPDGLNPYPGNNANADFAVNCGLVDFCEFNTYPDLWDQENQGWVDAWVSGHSASGVALGKPVLVKEQGMQPTDRRVTFYSLMYTADFENIVADRKKVGGLKGAAYWQAWVHGTKAVAYTLAVGGRFGILPDDPAAKAVRRFAEEVQDLGKLAGQCPVGANAPVLLPLPRCKVGREGPECEDVNECVRGTDDCSVHAACVNTEGHFKCKCHRGYLGDGRVCAPAPIHLDVIKSSFYTNDTINCAVSGQPVPYPKWAPGWVYDPTGLFDDSYDGNRVAVTLTQCKTACLMADDCTSFFWDAGQKKCLLRKDECPFISANVPGCQAQGSGIPVPTICTDGAKYTFNSPAPPTPVPTYECGLAVTYFKRHAELPAGCSPNPPDP